MTILITGSRGKTATELTAMLAPEHPVLIASRSPDPSSPHPNVQFDWSDSTTYNNPFEHEQAKKSPITAVYLVGLETENGVDLVINFIHLAVSNGVRRYVLLSGYSVEEGAPYHMGRAHAELHKLENEGKAEWAVIRPHFFMENFVHKGFEGYELRTIREEGKIFTAAGDGKKPFISARDIAAVAFRALVDEKPHNTAHTVTGPETLSYDDVAAILSEVLGRKIVHVKQTADEFIKTVVRLGLSEHHGQMLVNLDRECAQGKVTEPTDGVLKVTGKPPRSMKQFFIDNKQVFE